MLFRVKNTLKSNRNHTSKHAAETAVCHGYKLFFYKIFKCCKCVFFKINNKNLITRVIILILIIYGKT
jgi:hypothetical protein